MKDNNKIFESAPGGQNDIEATHDLQMALEEPLQKECSQKIIIPSTVCDNLGSMSALELNTKSEQEGAATEVAHRLESRDEQANKKNEDGAGNIQLEHKMDDRPFSLFTHKEKRMIVFCAGCCAFFSPISGQIYFPSLSAVAVDLHVSNSQINLTITTYLIIQGIAPTFIGGFSDRSGRRPSYLICFFVYMAANIGLGIQNNYAALLALRCLQSAGGSGTVALANAVVSDIVTSQERGVYVSYLSIAPQAGPSLGPIIGGLLGQYLGWHSIFWFLAICTGVVFALVAPFSPETCRKIVDDGSIPPPKWSRCYTNTRMEKRFAEEGRPSRNDERDERARKRNFRFPNPLDTLKIVFTREAGYALGYVGIVCCAYYATVALIPSQFETVYGFNQIQIALCYLPLGCGSLLAAFIRGRIIDSRYKAHAKRLGMPLEFNRRVDLSNFPIERARLEVAVPTLALASVCIIGFGWMLQYKTHLSGPLIFLFVIGYCISSSINTVSVLLVDIYPGRAGTATAAANIVRCWLGAGATSGVVLLINKVGIGWTTTFFGLLMIVFSPILWYIMKNGPSWRHAAKKKTERQVAKQAAKADAGGEKGQQ